MNLLVLLSLAFCVIGCSLKKENSGLISLNAALELSIENPEGAEFEEKLRTRFPLGTTLDAVVSALSRIEPNSLIEVYAEGADNVGFNLRVNEFKSMAVTFRFSDEKRLRDVYIGGVGHGTVGDY